MKENFKGVPGQSRGIIGDQSQESLGEKTTQDLENIVENQALSHAQNLVAGMEKRAAEQMAKAKEMASYATEAYKTTNDLANKAVAYKDQGNQIRNTLAPGKENLSQNSTISTDTAEVSNAQAISDHTIFGVNHLVDLKIVVEGTELKNFRNFQLNQTLKGHHEFVLSLSHDALGEQETYQMEKVQELLGKRILVMINFKNIKEKPERDFVGVITEVSFEQAHGSRGYITLRGFSPTILLDAAPHIQSFGGSSPVPLNTVVNQILEQGYTQGGKYNFVIKSSKNYNLSYTCQYNETHYNFLARMAEAYAEQFYYDGQTLYFGDLPDPEEPIQLVYGRDVENIQVRMMAQHVNRQLYGYNSLNNEKLSAAGDTKLQPKGTLAKAAYQKSESIFTAPSLQQASLKASTNQDVTQAQKGVIGSIGMNVFVSSGMTTVPFLYPGCIVELSMVNSEDKQSNFFTKLMITSVIHGVDTLGNYKGHFEAVDAETGFIPRIGYKNPLVEQQIATVVNNTDPQNKGRVQVRFDWQNSNLNSEFIRVMTPDAGSSDKVGSNRGFMAIPEVGDQVMVGFTANHPDRPYVMGGLFHGQTGAGGGSGNNIKSLSSKSGHIVELNDGGGITIRDKDQNSVFLSGDGHINVDSKETITLTCGKSMISMDKEGNILVKGKSVTTIGSADANMVSGAMEGEGESASLNGSGISVTPDAVGIDAKDMVGVSGKNGIGLESAEIVSVSSGETHLQGSKININ
ncbi:phage baseplate assembly protein V [Myroides sp. M-43]|uniref:type VI secretion system Vgr family protein n=1 Tax=Myroides oncorhynchi TaxID=2893756 RepID=UPI001E49272C|nr:phage baseplate assembly protein V [Myroides oncorhynchi]MCC9043554.1 phage baseplate assembly protein V [Myroides oncorhynchi]